MLLAAPGFNCSMAVKLLFAATPVGGVRAALSGIERLLSLILHVLT